MAFAHKKSLGQHFLTSPVVPGWMCDAAEIVSGETVLEIGPGTGVLTKVLLERGAHVIALEADPRAISVLEETFATELQSGQLTIHHSDVRSLSPQSLTVFGLTDHTFKVVANIPYYLSGFLFRSLLESEVQPQTIVFLIQKEVAERVARAQKESLLSLSVQAFGTARYIKTVGKGHFNPPPKVDSAIVAITDISRNHFADCNMELFFETLHRGFGEKRKQLLGNLSKVYDRTVLTHIFSTLEVSHTIRAEDLPLEMWLKLVNALAKYTNSQ